jgi:hypothetical protein
MKTYRVQKLIVIALLLIPFSMFLTYFYGSFHYIFEGFMHPPGTFFWTASMYSLGLYTFIFTSCLQSLVPCLWIGSTDRGELSNYTLSIFLLSLLTFLSSDWIQIVCIVSTHPRALPDLPVGFDIRSMLILPACLLVALGWSFFQTRHYYANLPLSAKIILRIQCLSCVFFVVTTYLGFIWAPPPL